MLINSKTINNRHQNLEASQKLINRFPLGFSSNVRVKFYGGEAKINNPPKHLFFFVSFAAHPIKMSIRINFELMAVRGTESDKKEMRERKRSFER
jgi:hypothetical protein